VKKIITVTCDQNYSLYAGVFINSLNANTKDVSVVVRAVNCTHDTINNIVRLGSNVRVIDDKPNTSTIRNILSHDKELLYDGLIESLTKNKTKVKSPRLLCSEQMAYCSNIKFMTIQQLLNEDDNNIVIYMDIDSIIRGNINELYDRLSHVDLAMFKDAPYTEQHEGSSRLQGNNVLYHGGLLGVNNNNRTRHLISEWVTLVAEDMFDWDADEDIFYRAHEDSSIRIVCVDKIYKDEDLDDKSVVWSGSGQTKFSHDRYIDECKKYHPEFG